VTASANFVSDCTHDPEHSADDEQNHTKRPKDRNSEQKSQKKKYHAESNHHASVVYLCDDESRRATFKILGERIATSDYKDL
jgi:hypothetical protein